MLQLLAADFHYLAIAGRSDLSALTRVKKEVATHDEKRNKASHGLCRIAECTEYHVHVVLFGTVFFWKQCGSIRMKRKTASMEKTREGRKHEHLQSYVLSRWFSLCFKSAAALAPSNPNQISAVLLPSKF
jgi:hypothetical protein